MHLLILDVDGTLVHSLDAEALLYPLACEQALGLEQVSSDWESYRCPSDRGIVKELVETRFEREASLADYAMVEQRFLSLIQDAYAQQPALCQPVAGAVEAVQHFRQLPDLALSIATAGWYLTAMHKMASVGLSVENIPIATANDAEEKAEIMKVVMERAAVNYGVKQFDSVICFGDTLGDARAASALGHEFIGIDTSGFVTDVKHCYADFVNLDEIIETMQVLQKVR